MVLCRIGDCGPGKLAAQITSRLLRKPLQLFIRPPQAGRMPILIDENLRRLLYYVVSGLHFL